MSAGLGGMIGNFIQSASSNAHEQRQWWRDRDAFKDDREVAFQRQDSTLQRLVADAQKAGVHPLYALGGSTSGGIPSFSSSAGGTGPRNLELPFRDKGAEAERAAAIRESTARSRLMELDIKKKEEDFAAEQARNSAAMRAVQKSNAVQDEGIPTAIMDPAASRKSKFVSDLGSYSDYPGQFDIVETPLGRMIHRRESGQGQNLENTYGDNSDLLFGPAMLIKDFVETLKYEMWRALSGRKPFGENYLEWKARGQK